MAAQFTILTIPHPRSPIAPSLTIALLLMAALLTTIFSLHPRSPTALSIAIALIMVAQFTTIFGLRLRLPTASCGEILPHRLALRFTMDLRIRSQS
jgi:hypothetical protein